MTPGLSLSCPCEPPYRASRANSSQLRPGAGIDRAHVAQLFGNEPAYIDAGTLPISEVTAQIVAMIKGIPLDSARSILPAARRRRALRAISIALIIAAFIVAILVLLR